MALRMESNTNWQKYRWDQLCNWCGVDEANNGVQKSQWLSAISVVGKITTREGVWRGCSTDDAADSYSWKWVTKQWWQQIHSTLQNPHCSQVRALSQVGSGVALLLRNLAHHSQFNLLDWRRCECGAQFLGECGAKKRRRGDECTRRDRART